MKTETNIHELAIRYFEGHISKAEEKLLFSYIEQAEENRLRFRQWEKEWKVTNEGDEQTMHEWQRLQRRLRTQEAIMPMLPRRYFSFWRIKKRRTPSRTESSPNSSGFTSSKGSQKDSATSSIAFIRLVSFTLQRKN